MNLPNSFIDEYVEEARERGDTRVQTRFPPEPNGYLHVGHAKAICLNFGIAEKYGGECNLRFDDTNPSKEEQEYVDSIMEDVRWLGFEWKNVYYASDYFDDLYECAEKLIQKGLAYVCELTAEEVRQTRGTLTEPGKNSPYRDRPSEESLRMFREMRGGKYPDGKYTLRAKIDMASPNVNMRDPVIYRILRATHHRTLDKWCIYPMYDYAHPISDAIEGVTQSLCTLEFEDHRPLYDWCLENLDFPKPPRQIEFARLGLTRTIMSKRYLKKLVDEGLVSGWDDPRMPTLSGLRRRGYSPEALRLFVEKIGIAKSNSVVDAALLEHCARETLKSAPRMMAVLRPLKVTLTNYPEDREEFLEMPVNQDFPEMGVYKARFSREIYIERSDFMETPPPKFFRLAPGREARLKGAYIIKCNDFVKDENGEVTELLCTYDPETRSGMPGSERKVKATLHFVDAETSVPATVRLYDYLLLPETEDGPKDFAERMNPDSIETLSARVEAALRGAKPGERFQFLRQGYFCADKDSSPDKPVFNEIVGLKDTYAKIAGR